MPRKTDSNNPADWLFIAAADLEGVRLLARDQVGYEMGVSKLAEVLEKILKAELLRLGWFLVKTHDLMQLAGELQARNSPLLPEILPLCDALADRYYAGRYPGYDLEDSDWPALRKRAEQVAALLLKVKARVQGQ